MLTFARLTEAQRLLLFHHDPLHDDAELDRLHAEAVARWATAGRSPHEVLMAAELQATSAWARADTRARRDAAKWREGPRRLANVVAND